MRPILAPVLLSLVLAAPPATGQSRTVFRGVPIVKISESGTDRVVDTLPRAEAINFASVVSEISGRYYWASRENKELQRHQSGVFITYTAVDGSGYVRVVDPSFRDAAALMSDTEATYHYVEHLLLGLRAITYYGRAEPR